MAEHEEDASPNPPYQSIREQLEAERARLYDYHRRAGTMGTYYDMYPLDRLLFTPEPERER